MKISGLPPLSISLFASVKNSFWRGRLVQAGLLMGAAVLVYTFRKQIKGVLEAAFSKKAPPNIQRIYLEPSFLKDIKYNQFEVYIDEQLGTNPTWTEMDLSYLWTLRLRPLKEWVQDLSTRLQGMCEKTKSKEWEDCQKQVGALENETDGLEIWKTMKSLLQKIKTLDQTRQEHLKAGLEAQLMKITDPEYNSIDAYLYDLTATYPVNYSLLGTRKDYLPQVGLSGLVDIETLNLREMTSHLLQLQYLCCALLHEENSLLKDQFDQEVASLIGKLQKTQSAMAGCKEMDLIFTSMLDDLRVVSSDAEKMNEALPGIIKQDKQRQLLQLKAYIHQQDNLTTWKSLSCNSLADYVAIFEKSNPFDLYKIGVNHIPG